MVQVGKRLYVIRCEQMAEKMSHQLEMPVRHSFQNS